MSMIMVKIEFQLKENQRYTLNDLIKENIQCGTFRLDAFLFIGRFQLFFFE